MPHYCLLETFQNCFYSPDNHYNTATSPELAEVLTVKNLFEKTVCLFVDKLSKTLGRHSLFWSTYRHLLFWNIYKTDQLDIFLPTDCLNSLRFNQSKRSLLKYTFVKHVKKLRGWLRLLNLDIWQRAVSASLKGIKTN